MLPNDGYYGGRVLADQLRPHGAVPVPVDLARGRCLTGSARCCPSRSRPSAGAADTVVASSRLIVPATSFGGVESTWERGARWPGETAPA